MTTRYDFVNNPFLFWPRWFNRLWARMMCSRGVHLFDDLLTDEPTNYVKCDACGFTAELVEIPNEVLNEETPV